MGSVRPEHLRAALQPLLDDPGRSGVLMDFDGTLAPIVDDPASVEPSPGAPVLLGHLAQRYAVVAVLSGRPLSVLTRYFPAGVALVGLYGLERLVAGERTDHEQAGAWREAIDDVAASLVAHCPEGVRIEPKGASLTVHFREHPELEAQVHSAVTEQARRSGLEVRGARMSVELHPPIDVDKGTALLELTGGLGAVCFIGDDAGDLSAFDALDDLALEGVATLRVAVGRDEAPAELLERADLMLDDPADVLTLLRELDTTSSNGGSIGADALS